MAGHLRNTLLLLLVSVAVRTVYASDTTSFFAYLREHAVEAPESVEEKSSGDREGRQAPTNGPGFSLSVSLGGLVSINGVSNFTFSFTVPNNPPVSCAGSSLNYCNYPDLPLIETYDLNYYARRPIPSGRCPEGYTKMPTFDCLNIAPALFETTCCVFSATTATTATLTDSSTINAFFCLANRTCYVITDQDAVFGFNIGGLTSATPVSGPFSLMAFTGGCLTSGVAEAETLGDGTVIFFTFADTFVIVDYSGGTPACTTSAPRIVTDFGVPGVPYLACSFSFGGFLVTYIDATSNPVLTTATLVSSLPLTFTGPTNTNPAATTNDAQIVLLTGTTSVTVQLPLLLRSSPFVNATACSYVPSLKATGYFIGNTLVFVNQQGTLLGGVTVTGTGPVFPLAGNKPLCSGFGACIGTSTSGTVVAPLVYIPYPIYPVFTGQQTSG
ncbi:hypothetical protein RvY_06141 [Ramazzottius varieornatus]|uniref:CUB domain-containing protein n=1 Tax=Ramazzottius varieornatus TaxID=947166 RepID=A0A1D1UY15_RAMVA|nr:hypothetical protein RvY_06141 [Ramazzottius varieornatus]